MIIVTTVGRSGSSALMEYLKQVSNAGDLVWNKYYEAGNENPLTVRINSEFRKRALERQPLRDFKLYTEIENFNLEVIKDPQFLVIPEIIEHWWYVRKDIKVILLEREPEKIVSSLKRKPIMNSPVFRNHTDMIISHMARFKKILTVNDIPYATFTFPDFIDQYEQVSEKLSEWGIKNNPYAWGVITRNKVHF